jgi:diaminohydroxyphosphoribosylaminopyrimidine deaminase / 5-amino-6-(5-phosphoribosylamino)uracil reductase
LNSFPLPEHPDRIMLQAVTLAEQAKGFTAPNPCVGALLTRNAVVVAQGYHRGPGLPHAEVEALQDAQANGVDPRECTLWVTLEPCNHTGRTPPCTQAITEAGIRQVVVGTADPNPHVHGGGIDHLRATGVEVVVGVAETACRDLIADFVTWVTSPFPYLYLKLAVTLDGRIAARSGDSHWISSRQSRDLVHSLRGRVGAVLVGSGTLRADNPRLTCRNPSKIDTCPHNAGQPLAVVVGSSLPDPEADFFLLRQRPSETIFWTTAETAESRNAERLRALGCRVWGAGEGKSVDLGVALARLRSELGVLEVMCEGGGRLAQHLVSQNLVGEWWLFLAPKTLGDEHAVPMLSGAVVERMDDARQWRYAQVRELGRDIWFVLRPIDQGKESLQL